MRCVGAGFVFVALALPAAAAGSQQSPSMSVSKVSLSAAWRLGWLRGSVRFTITVSGPTQVVAWIRPVGGIPVGGDHDYSLAAGTSTEAITLPARLPPKEYVLTLRGAAGGKTLPELTGDFTVPDPPDGVIEGAGISTVEGGTPAHVFAKPLKLWAQFDFLTAPPQARTVTVVWRIPSVKFVREVTKKYGRKIDSYVGSNSPLPPGRYWATLMVAGKEADIVSVRVS